MSKKTVLITGCSEGGIGAELARSFAKRRYHVYAAVRDVAKAKSLESDSIEIITLEVTDQPSIDRCKAHIDSKTGGSLDVLVNNAGVVFHRPLLDTSIDQAKQLFDVNVWALLAMTQAFAPLLIKSKGAIANISSGCGICWIPWNGAYAGSKGAVNAMSETLRIELEPLGVRVLTVITGFVATKIYENSPKKSLPNDSYYKAAENAVERTAVGPLAPNAKEDVRVYSENLANDIVGGRSGRILRGTQARTGYWATALLPTWLVDRVMWEGHGREEIQPPARAL